MNEEEVFQALLKEEAFQDLLKEIFLEKQRYHQQQQREQKRRLYRFKETDTEEVWMSEYEAVPLMKYTHIPGKDENKNLEGIYVNNHSDPEDVWDTILIDADYYDSLWFLTEMKEEKVREIFTKLGENIKEAHWLYLGIYNILLKKAYGEQTGKKKKTIYELIEKLRSKNYIPKKTARTP